MKTWRNDKVNIVTMAQMEKVCNDISGTCHRFWIHKVTKNRVYIAYSNPDEYANENPMYAVFPIYPGHEKDNENIVLDIIDVKRDYPDGEGWLNFMQIMDFDLSKSNPNQ